MNNIFSRIMKKKQKMEENFTDLENETGNATDPSIDIPPFDISHSDKDSSELNDIQNKEADGIHTHSESETDKLNKEIIELKDKYIRLYAEFDNFKRRTSKERIDLFKTANKEVLVSLLPIVDDFNRAQKSFHDAKELAPIKEGIDLINSKFKNILITLGLTEMKSIGEKFDTDLHEAITNIPAPNESLKGKVIDEMEKGYLLNDKVIRFAKVIVGV